MKNENILLIGGGALVLWLATRKRAAGGYTLPGQQGGQGQVGKIVKELPPGKTPCRDGHFSTYGPRHGGGVCSYHGGRQPATTRKRQQYEYAPGRAQNELAPDKTIKANITKAIEDVLTLPKFSNIKPKQAGILFNSFKSNPKGYLVYDELYSLVKSMMDNLEDNRYDRTSQGFARGYVEFDYVNYEKVVMLSPHGKQLMSAIQARLDTLKHRKAGQDMFPDIGGWRRA